MTIQQGFAIRRNGTCLSADVERDCDEKLPGFRACCPTAYECQNVYNTDCCRAGRNCTQELLDAPTPACANSTWTLFDNKGYFCCEPDYSAFDINGSNLCAPPDVTSRGAVKLYPVATVMSSSAAASATSTLDPSPSPQESSTPVGVIVGSAVGGAVGLVMLALVVRFALHRKRQSGAVRSYDAAHQADGISAQVHQLDDAQTAHEVAEKVTYTNTRELDARSPPAELYGEDRSPSNQEWIL